MYKARPTGQIHAECQDPECLGIWAMATKTEGFKVDKLGTPSQDSLGTHFLSEAITASACLHEHRAQEREQALRRNFDTTLTLKQYMRKRFRQWERGREPGGMDPPLEDRENSETDDEGWDIDSSHADWQEEDQLSNPEEYEIGDETVL